MGLRSGAAGLHIEDQGLLLKRCDTDQTKVSFYWRNVW